jgi:rhodanese-related sulfurtransferase
MSNKHKASKPAPPGSRRQSPQKRRKRNLGWLWISLAAVLVIGVVGILLFGSKAKAPVEITPSQAYAKYQQGTFFLDVRSQAEWDQYHISGATLIPLDQLQNRLGELPQDEYIVVVCRSGNRSLSGTTILQHAGFSRVSSMSGGLQAWSAAGYPVEGTAP